MVNYANGKIYRIVCNLTNKEYIGSTSVPLSKRLTQHRNNYKRYLNKNHHYVSSFEVLQNENYSIILIENIECKNKEELLRCERFYIEKSNNCTNNKLPIRSQKEYIECNKELLKEKSMNYREKNKDILKIRKKEYWEKNKDEINRKRRKSEVLINKKRMTKDEINSKKREYYENNKDIINQKKKEYYMKNKEKILNRVRDYQNKNKDEINRRRRDKRKEKK